MIEIDREENKRKYYSLLMKGKRKKKMDQIKEKNRGRERGKEREWVVQVMETDRKKNILLINEVKKKKYEKIESEERKKQRLKKSYKGKEKKGDDAMKR